jgi:hypothetical protein
MDFIHRIKRHTARGHTVMPGISLLIIWNIVFLERRGADAWIARLVRVGATLDDINGRGEIGRMAGANDAYGPHRIDRYLTCLDLAGPGAKGFAPFTFYSPIIHQQTAEPNRLVPDWGISCGNA